jgi:hypothetical protein
MWPPTTTRAEQMVEDARITASAPADTEFVPVESAQALMDSAQRSLEDLRRRADAARSTSEALERRVAAAGIDPATVDWMTRKLQVFIDRLGSERPTNEGPTRDARSTSGQPRQLHPVSDRPAPIVPIPPLRDRALSVSVPTRIDVPADELPMAPSEVPRIEAFWNDADPIRRRWRVSRPVVLESAAAVLVVVASVLHLA